jgi:hypothetical protein
MATYQFSGATLDANNSASTAPLVVLFERDDAIAVPLLSQLRLAGYDVRAARTPVELFDLTGKHPVSLVLVDLGNATAGRREFWVALDAQRRGRSMRVMTFRYNQIASLFDNDFEQSARAVADVDVNGPHEFQRVIDGVRQRLAPTGSAMGAMGAMGATSMPGLGGGFGAPPPYMPYMQNPTAAPGFAAPAFGASGMFAQSPSYAPTTPPPFQSSPFSAYPNLTAAPPSPFAYPADPYAANPFSSDPYAPYAQPSLSFPGMPPAGPFAPPAQADSPFAQPYSQNPFAADLRGPSNARPGAAPFGGPSAPPSQPAPFAPASVPATSSFEARAAHYSDIYAAQFGIADAPPQQSFERLTPPAPLDWAASPPFTPGLSSAGNGFGNSFAARPSDPFGGSRAGFDVGSNPQYGYAPNGGYAPTTAQPDPAPFSDAWTPPDGSQDADTGILYAAAHDANRFVVDEPEAFQQTARIETPDPFPAFSPREQPGRTEHAEHIDLMEPSEPRTRQDTEPYQAPPSPPSRPPVITGTPTDRALGSVLVEGALLTPQKLEALKGVQQMLSSVDMRFKLGELALLFKFLSQDQLLAALLVSRGLVSPEQIAGLGRVKQELAATGEDHDLDTLLDMFHILPPEQLRQLRTELGDIQAQVR